MANKLPEAREKALFMAGWEAGRNAGEGDWFTPTAERAWDDYKRLVARAPHREDRP